MAFASVLGAAAPIAGAALGGGGGGQGLTTQASTNNIIIPRSGDPGALAQVLQSVYGTTAQAPRAAASFGPLTASATTGNSTQTMLLVGGIVLAVVLLKRGKR